MEDKLSAVVAPYDVFMHGVPLIGNVVMDMHGGLDPNDDALIEFIEFIRGFATNVINGKSKVYVDSTFLGELLSKLEATASIDFKVNMAWTYRVLLDPEGVHILELSLHPYCHAEPVGYTVQ